MAEKRRMRDSIKYKVGITSVGVLIMSAFAIFAGMEKVPWTPKAEIEDMKTHIRSIEALKNQDNEWYRELDDKLNSRMAKIEITMAKTQIHVEHIKDDVKEIKEMLRR